MRRALSLVALIAAGLVCLRLALLGRPRLLAALDGSPKGQLAVSGRRVTWLEGDDRESRLMVVSRRGGRSRALLTAPRLSGLTVLGGTAYVTRGSIAESQSGRPSGAADLLAVSLETGAARMVAELHEQADQMVASDRWLVWRRARQAGLSGVPFVAAAAPMTVIRSAPVNGGAVNIVAVVRGEAGLHRDDIALLAISGDTAYWRQRKGTGANSTTLIRRAPCVGGKAETAVTEPGSRNAALRSDLLVWTAPSLEAGNAASFASVKRMALGTEKRQVEVIADWLDPSVIPMLTEDGQVYAQERASLWRLGAHRGEQRRLFVGPSPVISPVLDGQEQFMFLPRRSGTVLAKRPVSIWARVRSLIEW